MTVALKQAQYRDINSSEGNTLDTVLQITQLSNPNKNEWEPYSIESIRIPKTLYERNQYKFVGKLLIAGTLIGISGYCLVACGGLWTPVGIIGLGLMYAHLIELQHECLHFHGFKSSFWSRIVGVILGLPMMISYSHYQYDHFRHHRFLGTPENVDPFNYNHTNLNSVIGFVKGVLNYSRYKTVIQHIQKALLGKNITDGSNASVEKRVREEHLLFGFLLVSAIAFALCTANYAILALWLVPLLVAEPAHFLIELPEHYGLNAYLNPNVFANTRTIDGSWLSHWYTNYNTLHTAHHYNYGVPMRNIPKLHMIVKDHVTPSARNRSYGEFYKQVIRGEIAMTGK